MTRKNVRTGRLVKLWSPSEPSDEHLFVSCSADRIAQCRLDWVLNWIAGDFGQEPLTSVRLSETGLPEDETSGPAALPLPGGREGGPLVRFSAMPTSDRIVSSPGGLHDPDDPVRRSIRRGRVEGAAPGRPRMASDACRRTATVRHGIPAERFRTSLRGAHRGASAPRHRYPPRPGRRFPRVPASAGRQGRHGRRPRTASPRRGRADGGAAHVVDGRARAARGVDRVGEPTRRRLGERIAGSRPIAQCACGPHLRRPAADPCHAEHVGSTREWRDGGERPPAHVRIRKAGLSGRERGVDRGRSEAGTGRGAQVKRSFQVALRRVDPDASRSAAQTRTCAPSPTSRPCARRQRWRGRASRRSRQNVKPLRGREQQPRSASPHSSRMSPPAGPPGV